MPQANSPSGAVQDPKQLEIIINKFQSEVTKANENSNDFKLIVSRLSAFCPSCDMEKGEARPEAPEGALSTMTDLLEALKFVNRRNSEILVYFNSLV